LRGELKLDHKSQNRVHSGRILERLWNQLLEGYRSFHLAAFLTIHAQLVEYPSVSYSFMPGSVKSGLAAILAPFLLVEVYSNHGRIQRVLEV
jgi:hypothetical protein